MKVQIAQKDWERISAYLDGQLDPKAAEKVKRDLELRPNLRKAFADLQRYKTILKQVPRRQVQRNFTLKPEMVKSKPVPRLMPILQLASTAIAVLAVVLIGIDLVPSLTNSAAAVPRAAALTSAEAVPSPAPDIIYRNGQENYVNNSVRSVTPTPLAYGLGGGVGGYGGGPGNGGGGGVITSNTVNVTPPLTQPTESPVTPPIAGQVVAPPPAKNFPPTEPTPASTTTVNPTPHPSEYAVDQAIQSGADSPILGIPPTDQQGQIIPAPGETLRETVVSSQPSNMLTFLAIGLFLLAAAGGIVSWVLAKKK